jgi:hypothetical protein
VPRVEEGMRQPSVFASPRTVLLLYVRPLGLGTSAFFDRMIANGRFGDALMA